MTYIILFMNEFGLFHQLTYLYQIFSVNFAANFSYMLYATFQNQFQYKSVQLFFQFNSANNIIHMSKAQTTLGSQRLHDSPIKQTHTLMQPKVSKPIEPMTPQKDTRKQKNQFYQQRGCRTEQNKKNIAFDFTFSSRPIIKKHFLSGLESKQSKYTGCNCRKSQCLKMYCTCFAQGKMCDDTCLCDGCKNDHDNMDRSQAINEIIEKDPLAFSKKLDMSNISLQFQDDFCNCKKSNCAKKYCDCYRRGKSCNQRCNCTQCNNHEPHSHPDNYQIQDQKPKKKVKVNE